VITRRHHLQLVPPRVSEDTIRELRKLLADAERGQLVGLAYAAFCLKTYTVNAVGQANARPTMARGMLRDLDDLLRDRQSGRR
jgi:hypothetical protein